MAMMMTGRVLLVCALYVLWCGAGLTNGDTVIEMRIEENPQSTVPDPAVGNAKEQATQVSVKEGPKNGGPSLAAQTGNNTKQQKVVVETPPLIPVRTEEQAEEEEEEEEVKKEESEEPKSLSEGREESILLSMPEGERPPPPPPPPGKPSPVILNGNSAGNTNENSGKELPSSDKDSTQRQVLKSPAAESAPAATSQVKNEDLGSADVVSVQQVQKTQNGLESGSESIKEDSALTTKKKQDGTSDSHAESTPTIRSSAKSVAASNGPDETNEEEISNKNTAVVDAVPEAAQEDGNNDDSTKETPIKTTAITNGTVPTGDSDGSTAVSHTTSPLLLLILVACAAAAVVAA
ncbi:mucin-associated surface protein [Trypanosoma cruzi cruzi]|uniref:Mucin-associated surface protein (MASP) n=1 Tax=Trypanosoma cruzi TaxID=5693 RepID=A0A2V2VWP6_TRYCR|nr:mucin-associated surface protein [Trypanosoma cruzi cruzi]PWU98763.1 Mucin-associated surface protein (MASP) [Trypanosoma cruzi]